jgi:hypothetical protein
MEFDEKASLERWEQNGAFDSAEDCERNLDGGGQERGKGSSRFLASIENKYLGHSAIFSRCTASDDPRLK